LLAGQSILIVFICIESGLGTDCENSQLIGAIFATDWRIAAWGASWYSFRYLLLGTGLQAATVTIAILILDNVNSECSQLIDNVNVLNLAGRICTIYH